MINNIYRLPRCWVIPLKHQEVFRYIIGQQNRPIDSVQLINRQISRSAQRLLLNFNAFNKMKNLAVFALLVSAVTAAAVRNMGFSCPDQS